MPYLGTYETDLSTMPAAPSGFQWTAQSGTPVPTLAPLPKKTSPLLALGILGAGVFALMAFSGGSAMHMNPESAFDRLKQKLSHRRDVTSPGGLAAFIGRKKYGKRGFQRMAEAGRR